MLIAFTNYLHCSMKIISTAIYRLRVYSGNFKLIDIHADSLHDVNAFCEYLNSNLYVTAKATCVKVFKTEDYLCEDLVFSRELVNTKLAKDSSVIPFPLVMSFKRKRRKDKEDILKSLKFV